jgi:hypothetical protein
MAESGQQPTVDATLVNDIFEMLMEMDIRKIDIRLQRQYFDRLLHDLRNLQPPEVSVVRLRKFMSLLQKTVQNHSNAQNAAAADEPESLVPTAATGHTHGEQPGGVYRLDIADARLCTVTVTVRRDTKAKCEAVCDFGLVYIKRGNLQPGGRRASRLAPLLPRRRRRRRRLLMNSAKRAAGVSPGSPAAAPAAAAAAAGVSPASIPDGAAGDRVAAPAAAGVSPGSPPSAPAAVPEEAPHELCEAAPAANSTRSLPSSSGSCAAEQPGRLYMA